MAIKLRNIKSAIHDFVRQAIEKTYELAQEQKDLYASPILNYVKGFDIDKDSRTFNEALHKNAKAIDVPEGIQTINVGAFAFNDKIEDVSLPDSVTNVKARAFQDCENLEAVRLPKSIKNEDGKEEGMRVIRESTFENCKNLQFVNNLPKSLERIEDSAFRNCENLRIPSRCLCFMPNLQEIEARAFEGCKKFGDLVLPDTVKTLGESAFRDCEKLTFITLSNNLEGIEADTFRNCKSLANIEIPESVKYIEPNAFKNCESLESVTISANLNLNFNAFEDCKKLRELNVKIDNGQTVSFHLDKGENWADMPYAQNDVLLAVEALRNPEVKLEEFLNNERIDSFIRATVAVNSLDNEKAVDFVKEHTAEALIYCVESGKNLLFEEIKDNFEISKEEFEYVRRAEPFKEKFNNIHSNPDYEISAMLSEMQHNFNKENENDVEIEIGD